MSEHRKSIVGPLSNAESVTYALESAVGTGVGVMDNKGNIIKQSNPPLR